MNTITKIEIQKNDRGQGWSCASIVKYPDCVRPVRTNTGHRTLKSSLWHLLLDCVDSETRLTSVTVNGVDTSFTKVWEIVQKALSGGALDWTLDDIRELLAPGGEQ